MGWKASVLMAMLVLVEKKELRKTIHMKKIPDVDVEPRIIKTKFIFKQPYTKMGLLVKKILYDSLGVLDTRHPNQLTMLTLRQAARKRREAHLGKSSIGH